jgi:hypothetical protein
MAGKVTYEGKRELRWLEIGESLVSYMESEIEFSDKLWDDWMEAVRRPSVTSLLLCSWGPTQPTHQQWRRATRLMRDRKLPVAVVTDARHNLALAKAASWLGTNIQSYRWNQLGDACDFLGFDKADKIATKAKVVALRDRFGPVTSDAESGQPSFYAGDRSFASPHNPMAVSSELVLETSNEIQTKLAEIQERLRKRDSLRTS